MLLILPEVHCKELNPADAAVNQHHRSKRFLLLKKLIHKMGEEFIGSTSTVPIESQQKPVVMNSAAICSSSNYHSAAISPPVTAAPAYYPLAAEPSTYPSTYYTTSTTSSPPITPSPYYVSKEQVAGPPPYSLSQNDYNAPLPLDQFRF